MAVVDGETVDVKYLDKAKLAKREEHATHKQNIKNMLLKIEALQREKDGLAGLQNAVQRSIKRKEKYLTTEELWTYLNENYEVVHRRDKFHKAVDLKAVQMMAELDDLVLKVMEKDGKVTKYLKIGGFSDSQIVSAEDFKLQNESIAILERVKVQITKWMTNHSSLALELEAQRAMHSGECVDDGDEVVHFGDDGELVEETVAQQPVRRSSRIAKREAARAKPLSERELFAKRMSEEAKELDEVVEEWHKRN